MKTMLEPKWWWEDPSEGTKDTPTLEATYAASPTEGIVGMMDLMERLMEVER
jgi:hypothetical protein